MPNSPTEVVVISNNRRIESVILRSEFAHYYAISTLHNIAELSIQTVERPLILPAKIIILDALSYSIQEVQESLGYIKQHNLRELHAILLVANDSIVQTVFDKLHDNDEWIQPTVKYHLLHIKIQQLVKRLNMHKKHIRDINEASEIALLSMSHSSELGEISRFILKSYEYDRCDLLHQEFVNSLGMFNVTTSVLMITADDVLVQISDDAIDDLRVKILHFHEYGKKDIVFEGTDILMRFSKAAVVFHNIPPENDKRYDRLLANLIMLANCFAARVKGIFTENAAMAANRAKTMFLATMSHELRTPMNSVIGFADRLIVKLDGKLNDKESKQLQAIKRNGDHLLRLINDILDMSKIEAGQMSISPEKVEAVPLIESIVNQLQPLAINQNIDLSFKYPKEGMLIDADPTRLTQIVMNIASNAIKYTPEGSVSLTLDTFDDQQLGECLRLRVVDTGIGISQENQKKLFGNFVQIDSKLSRRVEGTGLGLAITQVFVSLHKGRIDVASEEGKGSCFTLLLPLPGNPLCQDRNTDTSSLAFQGGTTMQTLSVQPSSNTQQPRPH